MCLHGELRRLRPAPAQLTKFFLSIALGGALGACIVAFLAPLVFTGYWELQASFAASAAAIAFVALLDSTSWLRHAAAWKVVLATFLAGLAPLCFVMTARLTMGRNLKIGGGIVLLCFCIGFACSLFLSSCRSKEPRWHWSQAGVAIIIASLAILLGLTTRQTQPGKVLLRERNFYGTLEISEHFPSDPEKHYLTLEHGGITHGIQLVEPKYRRRVTTYYVPKSGIGLALTYHERRWAQTPQDRTLRVAAIGLGAGTIAGYSVPGDYFRFYELNPEVADLSLRDPKYFTFLADSPGKTDVVMGDARLALERELRDQGRGNFDVIVVDAFNGDTIPVHLLTREAVSLYLAHLRDRDGIIAVHISNLYVDLEPVVAAAAQSLDLSGVLISHPAAPNEILGSDWILLSRKPDILAIPDPNIKARQLVAPDPKFLWTDDYSPLMPIVKWK
jgi:hypothetical protein